ncbi:MAG: gliding motility-associated C-terminal domain-containing protein [Bacteroidota bacterium]
MKFGQIYIILFFFVLSTGGVLAQKEAWNWQFGDHSGLRFNEGAEPVNITSGVNTLEGTSSISDQNGNLLFYTDGVTVWNRNNQQMPNGVGLMGLSSSTQSALIVRKPGSHNLYYVFTADGTSGSLNHHMENGYRYSIVDMNLDNGLGDVTDTKNILLYAPSTEKLAAVKQADGVNIWLMTHEWNSSKFRAYSLTCDGLDSNPVISDVGESHALIGGNGYWNAIGQMKFSSDGSRLALALLGNLRVQVFDFNHTTGIVSNPINILAYWMDSFLQPDGSAFDFENIYGVEFSPNGRLLYLTHIDGGGLLQYDLSSGDSYGISATGQLYAMGPWCTAFQFGWSCPAVTGGLQLGPDGKIYGALESFNGLNVIANPDVFGSGCNYIKSPSLNNNSNYGLPTFMASYFDGSAIREKEEDCSKMSFTSSYAQTSSTLSWDFGDPNSVSDVSGDPAPTYIYSKAGSYTVSLILTNASGCTDTIRKVIEVKPCDPVIPNIITPNYDGINDLLTIDNISLFPENELIIFNRWGNEVFSAKNYSNETAFDGENCNEGVYFYKLVLGNGRVFNGFITIVK